MIEEIKTIVDHYGETMQKFVACEELGELIQEISKSVRRGKKYNNSKIAEEITDVFIVLHELMYIHHISITTIAILIDSKLERQLKRIEDERRNDN